MKKLENRQEEKKAAASEPTKSTEEKASTSTASQSKEWTDDEIKLLVKGAKIIAVGTRDRWDVIANFIEEHSRGKYKRTGKEVLNKTKEMQKMDPSTKEEMNKKAFEKTVQSIKQEPVVTEKPSERYTSNFLILIIKSKQKY